MEQWFSSDPHFGHANIIRLVPRPFSSANEMDEVIITRHNAVVKPEDHWTCLGDITMERGGKVQQAQLKTIISRLNGHKRLILGNHDHFPIAAYLEAGFEKIYAMHMIDNMRFTHIPIHPTSMGNAEANIHGHTHDKPNYTPVDSNGKIRPYINISMERTNYTPLTLGEIKTLVITERATYAQEVLNIGS